ncbi:MAG: class II aldolase/adducin family protein [Patulibacter sp.]
MATTSATTTLSRRATGVGLGLTGRTGWRRRERAVLTAGRTLVAEGLVIGTVGNVSARHGRELRITPTRRAYETMRRRDLVRVDSDSGLPLTADAHPSRELPLHLAVYRARPDVAAVIHTHSPYATAWSFLDAPLEPALEDLDYFGIGPVRTAAAAPPGSDALAANVSQALGGSNAVLLGHHGVLTTGRSVDEALVAARVVEHQARIAWLVRAPGIAEPL